MRQDSFDHQTSAVDVRGRGAKDVSLGAALSILAVTLVSGLIAALNFFFFVAAMTGPDSCEGPPCHGDEALAEVFLGLAVLGGVLTIGTSFTGRRERMNARILLSSAAIGIPIIGDLIAFAVAPAWL